MGLQGFLKASHFLTWLSFSLINIYMCVSIYVYMNPCSGTHRGQKVPASLELESQAIVNQPLDVVSESKTEKEESNLKC